MQKALHLKDDTDIFYVSRILKNDYVDLTNGNWRNIQKMSDYRTQ